MVLLSFKRGISQVSGTKRFVLFAWFINTLFALSLAVPLLNQLDGYIGGTVMEERLLAEMQASWFETYQFDFEKSEIARLVDYSIFGYAPFLVHLESALEGSFLKSIGNVFYALLFRWHLDTSAISLLTLFGFLYLCMNSFLAGGFIGVFAKEYRISFPEFLMEGGKYFGRFFRLSLLSFLISYLFFILIVDSLNDGIANWTRNAASEEVPFRYYMIRGVAVLLTLGVLNMLFDYARIRIVVEERTSVFGAFLAGARIAFRKFFQAFGLFLLLGFIGLALIALYALLEARIPQDSFWSLVLLLLLQQMYIIARIWLKAGFYACQTNLFREMAKEEHSALVSAATHTN